jgi:hypothetical protein
VRELAPQLVAFLGHLARISPSWCDDLRLVDATPVPCGQSRQTVKRSEFAGHAAYGYSPSAPASGTTGRSGSLAAARSPTITEWESVV